MNWTAILPWGVAAIGVLAVLGWTLKRSQEPGWLVLKWLVTAISVIGIWVLFRKAFKPASGVVGGASFAIALALGTVVIALVLALTWARSVITGMTSPLLRLFYDEQQQIDPAPLYSQAQALRKKGRFLEALEEVERQLHRFPNDLTGTLLEAEIHALDLNDLQTAEEVLETFMRAAPIGSRVVALNQMADWRLSLAEDLPGAREALERVRALCPDTEAAYMAGQRLAHLDNPEWIHERHSPKSVAYVEFPRPDRVGEVVDVRPKAVEPGVEASELVRHLESYPEDFEARERLATLYAEHYHRMDLARAELEQLIANRRAPRKKVTAWLNRLADLEISIAGDVAAARAALERVIRRDPKAAAAELARRRMNFLDRELRARTGPS